MRIVPATGVFVGRGSLLTGCAQLWLRGGHRVAAVVTPDLQNRDWARKGRIPVTTAIEDLGDLLEDQRCDYLFSIGNPSVLPLSILRLARRSAINFHDALLPRYAGVHATSWAIINQECTHGITFHEMIETVDAGPILQQRRVNVECAETAFSLNVKCYEAAIAGFTELIDAISTNNLSAMAQPLELRSYVGKSKRPFAAGTIFFHRAAQELDALIRALDFGPYANPLCRPKLLLNSEVVAVGRLKVLESGFSQTPGMIIAVEDDVLRVATVTHDVALAKFETLEGQPIALAEVARRNGLAAGMMLPELEPNRAQQLTEFTRSVCCNEEFWTKRLIDPAPIGLSFLPRSTPLGRGDWETTSIAIPASLHRLARQLGDCSMCDILVAAFAAYLARISGQNRFDLGFCGQALRAELSGLEAWYVTQVPLRINVDLSASVDAVIGTVASQLRQVRQQKTFARDLIARSPQLTALGSAGGVVTFPIQCHEVSDLEDHHPTGGATLVLVVSLNDARCRLDYDSSVLPVSSADQLRRKFGSFLEEISGNRERRLGEIFLLNPEERKCILQDWNATAADYPREATLYSLFAAQVALRPDAVAVVFGEQRLTYAELAARATRLASRLHREGVGPEVLVGLLVERSLEMVVALVAILQAGGGYLPLDPEQAPQRLAAMLEDARPPMILVQDHLAERLPPIIRRILPLSLGDVDDGEAVPFASPHLAGHGADTLAYVSFTSGSTGRPKGIAVTHRNVMRLVKAANFMSLDAGTTFLQLAPLAFDASTLEIWGPLLNGGRLVVMPPPQPTLEELGRALVKQQVNTLWLSAGLFQVMAEERPGDFAPVHQLLAGGDVLSPTHVRKVLQAHPGLTLINGYGPTENTTFTCCYRMTEPGQVGASVPIGMPIGATQVYVLDAWLKPVPVGVAGELYAGGDGLARGYLNQSALTAERFVANPFGPPGSRLYRTGDLVRWRADGVIEFLGRLDHQVKIRGFRVEPGEVEAALVGLPGVREAVVVARPESGAAGQTRRLVAYVVPQPEEAPTVAALRRRLKERLPDYMVPADLVLLAALPLTANGKIDRRALPVPEAAMAAETDFIAPRTELEHKLQAIWQDLLGVSPVGMRDSFFALGGHSLLATRLFSRTRKLTGHDLPLAMLFKFPTIEGLAGLLSGDGSETLTHDPQVTTVDAAHPWSPLVEIAKGTRRWPLFCVHNADGNVLNYYDLARHLGPDQPVYGLQAQGTDGQRPPLARIEDMVALYLPQVRRVQPTGPYFLAGHSGGGVVAFEMAQQLIREGEEVALLALLDTVHPSVSARGLTVRQRLQIARGLRTPADVLTWPMRQIARALKARRARQLVRDGRSIPHYLRAICIFDAFALALTTYRPERYPNRIHLFQSTDGNLGRFLGYSHGWTDLAEQGVDMQDVPGTHLGMMYEPNVGALAAALGAIIHERYRRR